MFLLINKPKGMTSHDVVYRVRRITGEKKVGHGGTLDPNATGLLIVGVGRESTKQLGEITKNTNKEYLAEITLGEERSTDDSEGKVVDVSDVKEITKEKVEKVVNSFIGEQEQIPPIYSAIKKDGKKAYQLARKGKEVKMEPRKVTVYEAEIVNYKFPVVEVRFKVSSGTYIRSLARDIGRKLGTYGYLSNLKRTKIGDYDLKNAVELDDLK